MNARLAIVVTLCLALSLAGFLSPTVDAPPAKDGCCSHGPASAGTHLPCAPCATCCPVCGGPCVASLPGTDRIGVDLAVVALTEDLDASGNALTYPPPLPPPRLAGLPTVSLT